jgi:methylmalonyl-CoA mutase
VTDHTASALDEPEIVDHLDLASAFPAATKDEWRRLVAKVLGDAVTEASAAAPERLLDTILADGIEVEPLYTADDAVGDCGFPGDAPFLRGTDPLGHRDGWDVRQRHAQPDPALAREQIMADLEGGVSSVWLQLGPAGTPVDSLPQVLAEVYLDLAPIVLDAGDSTGRAAELLFDLARSRNVAADQLRAGLGADPLGQVASHGGEADLGPAIELARRCAGDYPQVHAFVVDGLAYHEAGGTDVEELACSLATGVAYLREMQAAGFAADVAFGQLEFRYAATADQFATIAKLRAARRVWARVAQGCGVTGPVAGQRQHAVTSWSMMTRRDPWNNMLRATLACFGAGVGGADAVTVLPFDAAIGLSDDLARRIARNTHALLVEESHVARVIDPAGGSWYVETLTETLAQKAWEWFQVIERAGGMGAALSDGLVGDQISFSRAARRDSLAHRRDAITGVSEFPLLGETVLDRPAAPGPDTGSDLGPGLPRVRWSQWHEELRDRSDAHAAAVGTPPTVMLVPLGAKRGSGAQADRARSLLAPAGVVGQDAALDDLTGGEAARAVCLCVADDVEAGQVDAAIEALRAAGVRYVLVAGSDAKAADDHIVPGLDALAFQARVLDALGVAP